MLSVTNFSSENNLPTFQLNAPVIISIQSKYWQVIFQTKVTDNLLFIYTAANWEAPERLIVCVFIHVICTFFFSLSPPGMTFPWPSLMHPSREPVKMFRQSFERCQPLLCWGTPARTDMARLCSLTYLGRWWSSTRREWEPSWTFWWGSHPCWAYTLEHQEEGEWKKVYDCILLKTRGVACTQSRAHKNGRLE